MYVVGIDGGGTRTRAALVDVSGQCLKLVAGGCGNYQLIGLEGVERLLAQLLDELGTAGEPIEALCAAMAGAGRPGEQKAIANLVQRQGWARKVCAVSDALGALEGAHGGAAGIIAIAGTGSIVVGRNGRGECARAGGWGPLLGDEGSGYSIALEALRKVLRARDGWGESTILSERLQETLGLAEWDEIVRQVYGGELDRKRLAALSPQVFAAARSGDAVARCIIDGAGAALGALVAAVARRLDMGGEVDLACAGGVFAECEMLWPALYREARREVQEVRLKKPQMPPVLGAVLLARRQLGLDGEEQFIAELVGTDLRVP